MNVLHRLKLCWLAAVREWRSHTGWRAAQDEYPPFAVSPLLNRGPYNRDGAILKEDMLNPPYFGEFLADVGGRKYALRHHAIDETGQVRYLDEKVPGYYYIDEDFLQQSGNLIWLKY